MPPLEKLLQWQEIPAYLRAYTQHHLLYMPDLSDLNAYSGGPLYPDYFNIADLLAAGEQPLYLVHALLNRRIDAVEYLPTLDRGYSSGMGRYEENYMWKLDQVIAARYTEEPGAPPGTLGRRPGPEQAAWMRYCFEPFSAGGASFRIHHGGGFWCSFQPGVVRLVAAPVPVSEVVTTESVSVRGTISVTLEEGAASQLTLVLGPGAADSWRARVAQVPGHPRELAVVAYQGATRLGEAIVTAKRLPQRRVGVALRVQPASTRPGAPSVVDRAEVALTVPLAKAELALLAGSGATADLRKAHLVQ